jgi:ketosteroid isomerase-like protein
VSPTLRCGACGARWHTAARRGRTSAANTCLRCGGSLAEVSERPLPAVDTPMSLVDELAHAWEAGEIDRALELCHHEIEISEIEALLPGHDARFQGHAGARRWMELIRELWDVEFRAEPREKRVVDESSVELLSALEARSSGELPDFSAMTRSLWQFEDGKLRRVQFSVATAAAADAPRA